MLVSIVPLGAFYFSGSTLAFKGTVRAPTFHQPPTLSSRVQHKRNHRGEKPFKCTICQKVFKSSGDLTKHKTHSGEKPYQCFYCQKAFTTSSALTVHKRKEDHTREKPYHCLRCEKAFTQLGNLEAHKCRHTNHEAVAIEQEMA